MRRIAQLLHAVEGFGLARSCREHVHDDDSLALLERKVGRDRLVLGTNLAGWDAPTERDQIPFVDDYDRNARRLLRLDR